METLANFSVHIRVLSGLGGPLGMPGSARAGHVPDTSARAAEASPANLARARHGPAREIYIFLN